MKKILLTSMLVMCVAVPAMADPQVGNFPDNGLMQENYIYTEAATYENMGVYSGTVIADPEYAWNYVDLAEGQYLPANATEPVTCPSGSFCPGGGHVHYDDSQNPQAQGITPCPNDYSGSADGATSNTQCYRTCETGDVANATEVTGAMYHNGTGGDGVNACAPTANGCAAGYHYVAGSTLNLATEMGEVAASGYGYKSNDGISNSNTSTYGITENGTFVVDYGNGKMVRGKSQCSTLNGTNNDWSWTDPTISAILPDSTGQYCYCRLDGYTLNGLSAMQDLSASWVFDHYEAGICETDCVSFCASNLGSELAFRTAVFGAVESNPTLASCEANTIEITWNGTTAEAISNNNAGQCTYGGDIRTPQSAVVPNGKRFVGWRFRNEND